MTDDEFALAEFISSNDAIIQAMVLIKYGIPFDVALSLDDATRFGYCVIFKTMYEQMTFDFQRRRWRPLEAPKAIKL